MRQITFFGLLAAASVSALSTEAAYTPRSEYLETPDANLALVLDTAHFWMRARDDVNGGYYNYIDDAGNPVFPSDWWWGTEMCGRQFDYHLRTVFGQSRLAYAFTRAFMITGDVRYLDHAQHALDFMYRTGWDQQHGGWFFTQDQTGTPAPWLPCDWWDPNAWKWTFNQVYPLLGIAAISEATMTARNGSHGRNAAYSDNWSWLMRGVTLLDEKLWDRAHGGYYEDADLDWSNPRGKGFTGAADSITTHAVSLYLQTGNGIYRDRFLELADILAHRLVPTIELESTIFGFVENFDAQWNIDPNDREGYVGHLLKASWSLARAYQVSGNPEYRTAAMKIIHEVWNNGGWDHVHGGPFQDFDWMTGYIKEGKQFWNVEQGFTSGITNYHIADNEADRDLNLQMADESLDFFMNFMRDPADGVAYTSTLNDGTPDDTTKGHLWKAGYHASEMGYLAYLYGSLYYKQQPVTLYYHFAPRTQGHVAKLSPVEDDSLVISSIRLNGKAFKSYDPRERVVSIPPGTGGVFEVTFSPAP